MFDSPISDLSESLVDELVGAVGLPRTAFWHRLFWLIFRRITDRLAALGINFDRLVASEGLPAGSTWILRDFCNPIPLRGRENIPMRGPLLVTSNHPGAYDGLVIFSKLVRLDIHWIGTEIPFLQKLPAVSGHILYASRSDASNCMAVMRSAIRHLQSGGTLVYFGAGHRDPDPAVYPGAGKMLECWLEGIDFFFKHVPHLRLLPAIVSGVVSQKWARHPVTRLRRAQIDQQRLAEFGQVITQLLYPRRLFLSPVISFGPSASGEELRSEGTTDSLLPAVIQRQKALLVDHCRSYGGHTGL